MTRSLQDPNLELPWKQWFSVHKLSVQGELIGTKLPRIMRINCLGLAGWWDLNKRMSIRCSEPWLTHSKHQEMLASTISALESPSSSSSPGPSFWVPPLSTTSLNLWDLWGVVWSALGVHPTLNNNSLQPLLPWVRVDWVHAFSLTLGLLARHRTKWSRCHFCFQQSSRHCLGMSAVSPLKTGLLPPGFGNHTRVGAVPRRTLVASEYFNFLTRNHLCALRNLH